MKKSKKKVVKNLGSKKMIEKFDKIKEKFKINKKTTIFVGIIAVCIISFIIIHSLGGLRINGNLQGAKNESGISSPVQAAPAPTCTDGILNQGETRADCGGPCDACPPICSDGIQNQGEEKVDCGGPCAACPTCSDKILNQGERLVDCGGPCTACPPDCSDGIKNQDETGIDCGGKNCTACPTCFDKILNQGERLVDCGGPCVACPPDCSDGIQNQGEEKVDCGGPCAACVIAPVRPVITDAQKALISKTIMGSQMIKDLPSNSVIALRFYDFFLGERIWQPDILIGNTGIIASGTPDMALVMHAKYIDQLNGANLCEVITSANTNGEMWSESSLGTAKLLMKYSGMMKYKSCFGI